MKKSIRGFFGSIGKKEVTAALIFLTASAVVRFGILLLLNAPIGAGLPFELKTKGIVFLIIALVMTVVVAFISSLILYWITSKVIKIENATFKNAAIFIAITNVIAVGAVAFSGMLGAGEKAIIFLVNAIISIAVFKVIYKLNLQKTISAYVSIRIIQFVLVLLLGLLAMIPVAIKQQIMDAKQAKITATETPRNSKNFGEAAYSQIKSQVPADFPLPEYEAATWEVILKGDAIHGAIVTYEASQATGWPDKQKASVDAYIKSHGFEKVVTQTDPDYLFWEFDDPAVLFPIKNVKVLFKTTNSRDAMMRFFFNDPRQ
jgi:hypothetical protein